MRRFDHLDALCHTRRSRRCVVVAGDHQAAQGGINRPQSIQGMGHGASSLASAQNHGTTAWHGWQTSGHVQQGLGTDHRCVKQLAQKLRGILGVKRGRSHGERAYRIASS